MRGWLRPWSQPKPTPAGKSTCDSNNRSQPHVQQKPTVLLIGDSIPKGVIGHRMSRRYRVINRCIPGSKLHLWTKIAPAMIQEENPICVIIHCATNNLHNYLPNECIFMYKELITAIHHTSPNIHIAVSALTFQEHVGPQKWIHEFNARLRELCNNNPCLSYICNDNITAKDIAQEDRFKIHLSGRGTALLAQNYISFLRAFLLLHRIFFYTETQ